MRTKKGTLGTIISLVLMLLVVGITFKICSTIFRRTDESKASFEELIQKMDELKGLESGSRKMMIAQLNEQTAIMGFSRGRNDIELGFYNLVGDWRPQMTLEKPEECGEASCACYCEMERDDITGEYACTARTCVKGEDFGNLDLHPRVYNENLGSDGESRNGFFFYRGGIYMGDVAYITPLFEGRFSVTLERVGDKVAVCAKPRGGSCVAPESPT